MATKLWLKIMSSSTQQRKRHRQSGDYRSHIMIHDAIIMDGALVGMKSMICENVSIGENTIEAEQSLIRKNTTIPSEKIVAGSPAKVVADITERHRNQLSSGIQVYLNEFMPIRIIPI